MAKVRGFLLCTYLGLCSFGTAEGKFTYISQNRYVSASNDKGSAESITAANFSPFDAGASVTWERIIQPEWRDLPGWQSWYDEDYPYSATSRQTSVLGNHCITIEGHVQEGGPFVAYEHYFQSATSYTEVSFEITEPYRFTLTASLATGGDHGGHARPVHNAWFYFAVYGTELPRVMYDDSFFCRETVFLEPGSYTIYAGAFASTAYSGGVREYPYGGVGGGSMGEYVLSLDFAPVPAPGAIALCTIGVGFVGWLRRRRTF